MEDPLLLQFLTDHEVDLVVLDLPLGFYKSTSASDLDLIFSKREHLGLKSEFREKLQKWKRAQVSLIFNIFIIGCNNFKF